jgi:hypothetical protein
MKTLFLSLMVVFGASNAIFGQVAIADNGAKISFTKEVHDYGTIKNGADRFCTFEFKNTGNAPLIISNAKGSCGCTVPTWPKEPIAPGEKGTIKVEYDTKRAGAINKSVTISSNAVNAPEQIIRIKGNVLPAPEDGTPVNNAGPSN